MSVAIEQKVAEIAGFGNSSHDEHGSVETALSPGVKIPQV
ncbi:hypothetical protein PDR5_45690 [Pseudomonas sp. DR 5-09]|nr:hypothetical protein PDR5_45690 [Pseudomonas sp. DR 5-09]